MDKNKEISSFPVVTVEPIYKEVFKYVDEDKMSVCQIFLRDGYTIDLGGLKIDKEGE